MANTLHVLVMNAYSECYFVQNVLRSAFSAK